MVAFHKTPTTPDIQEGVETAIEAVVKEAKLPSGHVDSVKIGTTVRLEVLFAGFRYLLELPSVFPRLGTNYTKVRVVLYIARSRGTDKSGNREVQNEITCFEISLSRNCVSWL